MRVAAVLLVLLLPLVSGCRLFRGASAKECHSAQPYQKAQSVQPLKIPGGLDAPDTTNALRLPALNEPAPAHRSGKQPCLDEPPSFKVTQPAKTPQT
jgi:uncharacterized lipoprotein